MRQTPYTLRATLIACALAAITVPSLAQTAHDDQAVSPAVAKKQHAEIAKGDPARWHRGDNTMQGRLNIQKKEIAAAYSEAKTACRKGAAADRKSCMKDARVAYQNDMSNARNLVAKGPTAEVLEQVGPGSGMPGGVQVGASGAAGQTGSGSDTSGAAQMGSSGMAGQTGSGNSGMTGQSSSGSSGMAGQTGSGSSAAGSTGSDGSEIPIGGYRAIPRDSGSAGAAGQSGYDNGMRGSSTTGSGTQSGAGAMGSSGAGATGTGAPQSTVPPSEMNGSDATRPGSPPPDLPPGKPVEQH